MNELRHRAEAWKPRSDARSARRASASVDAAPGVDCAWSSSLQFLSGVDRWSRHVEERPLQMREAKTAAPVAPTDGGLSTPQEVGSSPGVKMDGDSVAAVRPEVLWPGQRRSGPVEPIHSRYARTR